MASPERYICIHGHFYQPPRENPWLETVETQDSAAPYHDWNDRITAECYAPNGAARVVNGDNRIIRILNNYGRMSFNFGPTLLSWLQENAHRVYQMILDADEHSCLRFGGHGSAMAQVYNHIIMPLASTRDRITQIRWGKHDFEHRFGRKPEGMWLAETACDTETLQLLAEDGIKFVVLAPHQCARIRPIPPAPKGKKKDEPVPEGPWIETANGSVDTTRPYRVNLGNGRSIAIFFYDGARSRAVAFEGILNDGETFARRLMGGFSDNSDHPQIVHIATDGESYGHHHRYGEMALAWAMKWIETDGRAKLTNYGEFLAKFPPAWEAQIVENTSWSCVHGVERWRSNCGCNSGRPGWNQEWRRPLREGLDQLRDSAEPLAAKLGATLFKDVDAARNAYISVILNRNKENIDSFFALHATHELSEEERRTALKLMELERHELLMYTSCGWFFDEITGIETVQIIAYASRMLQLAAELFGDEGAALEKPFLDKLATAKSNLPDQKDGATAYERYVRNMELDLEHVGAHYAISSVFKNYPEQTDLFCYSIRQQALEIETSGRGRLEIGRASICSKITEEQETIVFAVLHFGDQNITAAVKPYREEEAEEFARFTREARAAVVRAELPEVIRGFDRVFPMKTYSIRSLFKDEQQRIVEMILKPRLERVEASLASIYDNQASLLHFLSQSGLQRPPALTLAATFAINAGLKRSIESSPIDSIQMRTYLGLAASDNVVLDRQDIGYMADQRMKQAMIAMQEEIDADSGNTSALDDALLVARTVTELPFELNLWQAQNIWYDIYRRLFRTWNQTALDSVTGPGLPPAPAGPDVTGIEEASTYASQHDRFVELGKLMGISVDDLVIEEETPLPEDAETAIAE
ncbi:DUF3536 domain-containing protein [Silvibacterium acidisoli]|uniref:DUF3536 domain-containing protein n=1 Tax=Acidobacteriaceae bacterium ZG23-2 TaxID=2883246 RepID=UPI00406D21D6